MRSLTRPSASSVPANLKAAEPITAVPVSRLVVFWLIAIGGCALDLLTKHWVFQWRGMPRAHNEWWIWEPFVGIETALNRGALFGLGGGFGRVFAMLSVAAAVGILFWLFYGGAARDRWLTIALGCVMAGIAGNLYDRVGLSWQPHMSEDWSSAVRDWILFRYGSHTWPNFNIADSLLVSGAAILLWHSFFPPNPIEPNCCPDDTNA
jgi:signal peptidase II